MIKLLECTSNASFFLRYYYNKYLFPSQRMNKFVHLIEINNSIQEEN